MGEGVAQVYAPLAGMVGGLNMGAFAGAAATLAGTPLGVGSVLGLSAKMIGNGLGASGAGLLAAAGPIGMIGAGLTFAGLATSYAHGLGESWTSQPEGSVGSAIGRAIRPGQIAAEQAGIPSVLGTLSMLTPGSGVYNRLPYVQEQIQEEERSILPGTLQGDAQGLRSYIRSQYGNRVNVDQFLGLTGSALQLGGTRAQDLYTLDEFGNSKAPEIKKLLDKWATYIEGGASPEQLYSSQLTSVNAAGVPMGGQAVAWMNRFADIIPGEQRQIYEQAFQSLSPLSSATMRPTTFEEAGRAVQLAQATGSMQRATNMVMGQGGVGWFTNTFGLEQEGAQARGVGSMLTSLPIAQQETIQRYGGTVASSGSRMGMSGKESSLMSMMLGTGFPNDVLAVSNLVVQAESVSLEAGKDKKGFAEMLYEALGAGMAGKSAAEGRFFMAAGAGTAGIAPQAFVPGSQQAENFEKKFKLAEGQDRIRLGIASGILNSVYPEGYTEQQTANVATALKTQTIGQVTMGQRAAAGTAGVGVSMGLGYGSAGAQLIDSIMTQGLGSKEVGAMSQALNANNFMYMNAQQMSTIAGPLQGAFSDFYNNANGITLHQFNRVQEALTGSTPWGFSQQQGFGPGSLTDRLGRQYGMYSGDPGSSTWTSSDGGQYAPLFDLQQSAGYASLGYASASNEAQSRQFARQQAQMRREWGSGPFQSMGAVQSALFGEGAQEPGSGVQIGDSSIGYAQQESAIRRQMWQESVAAQQQSIQFSRQSLEISRQELGIAKQELELSKQQYGIQREYKLSEQQAQRGMQLRQYEWAAEDYSIKVERTGVTQQWQMEDLQRSRRYSTGRQRVEIERQIERTQLTQGWERDDQSRGRNRELETQRYQDQRYEAAVAFEQKLHALQMQRFELQDQRMALQDQRLALQDAQLAAQEARLNNQTVLQEKLNKLEDDRFKAQYEQTQAQMVDDEKMEKLRKGVRDAEIAYQAASLANAATIKDAQEKFTKGLEGIEGPLDKLIEFLNAIRNWQKPPDAVTPPAANTNDKRSPLVLDTLEDRSGSRVEMSSTMSRHLARRQSSTSSSMAS